MLWLEFSFHIKQFWHPYLEGKLWTPFISLIESWKHTLRILIYFDIYFSLGITSWLKLPILICKMLSQCEKCNLQYSFLENNFIFFLSKSIHLYILLMLSITAGLRCSCFWVGNVCTWFLVWFSLCSTWNPMLWPCTILSELWEASGRTNDILANVCRCWFSPLLSPALCPRVGAEAVE